MDREKFETKREISAIVADALNRFFARIPVVGAAAAGTPILAAANRTEEIEVPEWLAAKADFALDIEGDSMEPRIGNGDRVIVRKAQSAENGDIVVTQVEDRDTGDTTASVKYLRDAGGVMVLRSANPAYEDVPVTNRHQVIGVVEAVVRHPGDWMPPDQAASTFTVGNVLPVGGEQMGLAETFAAGKRIRERDESGIE